MKIQRFLILILAALLCNGCAMKFASRAIDPEKYLTATETSVDVYKENADELFYNPFNFGHDDFGRLILISIQDHPEIKEIELIVQDDNKGAIVVMYYHNGLVDNYVSSGFASNKEYVKLDKNWRIIGERDFEYVFNDTPKGVNVSCDITIKNEQRLTIRLQENRKDVKRFSMLATIGAELHDIQRFPFIFLKEAGLIPIEGTTVSIELDGEKMNVAQLPIKAEGEKCYRLAFALTRLAFFWNEERNNALSPVTRNRTTTFEQDNALYSLFNNNGYTEIERIVYNADGHSASFRFSPAFPDIGSLKNGSTIYGKFSLGVDEIDGIIGGKYTVVNTDGIITIDIHPEKCWGPIGKNNWVSAYHYHAELHLTEDNIYQITSFWTVKE